MPAVDQPIAAPLTDLRQRGIGATDERGAEAVAAVRHIRGFRETLLRHLGLDDNRLTFYHAGRFKQLSQFGGQVIEELIG